MKKIKDAEDRLIRKHGEEVLIKLLQSAIYNDNSANQRFVVEKYLGKGIKLKGKNAKQLVNSLIKQASRPGVTKDAIDSAIKIIRVHMDASELKEIQDRLDKLEKA